MLQKLITVYTLYARLKRNVLSCFLKTGILDNMEFFLGPWAVRVFKSSLKFFPPPLSAERK